MAIWRYTEAAPDLSPYLDPISAQAGTAYDTANNTARELQKYLAEQNAGASGGKAYSPDFSGNGFLPADMIQDAQSGIRLKNSVATIVWPYDTGRLRTFMALTADPLDGDDQSAVITVAGTLDIYNNGDGHATGVVVCGNSTATQGIVAWCYRDRIELGHISNLSNGTATVDVWTGWNIQIGPSPTIELRRTGYLFKIVVNGNVVAQHQGTVQSVPYTGPNYRRAGFTLHAGWGAVFWKGATPVGSLSASDISVPATKGAGWVFSRTTSNTTDLRGSGWQILPQYTFDMTERIAGCQTTGDYQAGGILIQRTDWYNITLTVRLNTVCGSNYTFAAGLYYAPVAGGPLGLLRQAPDTTGSSQYYAGGSFCEYLQAGSMLAPAVYQAGANKVAAGNAAGVRTYFSGFARG